MILQRRHTRHCRHCRRCRRCRRWRRRWRPCKWFGSKRSRHDGHPFSPSWAGSPVAAICCDAFIFPIFPIFPALLVLLYAPVYTLKPDCTILYIYVHLCTFTSFTSLCLTRIVCKNQDNILPLISHEVWLYRLGTFQSCVFLYSANLIINLSSRRWLSKSESGQ